MVKKNYIYVKSFLKCVVFFRQFSNFATQFYNI